MSKRPFKEPNLFVSKLAKLFSQKSLNFENYLERTNGIIETFSCEMTANRIEATRKDHRSARSLRRL